MTATLNRFKERIPGEEEKIELKTLDQQKMRWDMNNKRESK